MSVFRSNKHIYAQIIDDEAGRTLVSASTLEKDLAGAVQNASNKDAAVRVGKIIAERAIQRGRCGCRVRRARGTRALTPW